MVSHALPPCPQVVASDADALLRLIAPRIDDAMLREIASADYGRDVDLHLSPLRLLRDEGRVPEPLVWEPREVLELIRWSEPDDAEWGPGGHGERGHWMRAFASAGLLRCELHGENLHRRDAGQNQTLAALLTSLRTLGFGFETETAGLVMWAIERLRLPSLEVAFDEAAFFGTGMLWSIVTGHAAIPDADLLALCEWIAACEGHANMQAHAGYGLPAGHFLLSTTNFNLNHAKWRSLGADLAGAELSKRSPGVRDWVRMIGTLVAGE